VRLLKVPPPQFSPQRMVLTRFRSSDGVWRTLQWANAMDHVGRARPENEKALISQGLGRSGGGG
jgi:hypothetical protein